jgi:6-phosphogluconolactonase
MNFRIFDSLDDLIRAAAGTIVQRASASESISIALSGGNTPKPLYELLGSSPQREMLAKKRVTWVVVDERCVPITDPQSNAGMIGRTLFASGMSKAHQLLHFRTEFNEPSRSAIEFERVWRDLGLQKLDVVILGLGEDGHTASLFPGTPVVDVEDRIASEVFVPRLNSWRVTLTMPVIRAAKLRIVLAAGASKREIIRQVREGADYPIARATAGDIESWWFADRAAMGE